jgi:hypothetical protein
VVDIVVCGGYSSFLLVFTCLHLVSWWWISMGKECSKTFPLFYLAGSTVRSESHGALRLRDVGLCVSIDARGHHF